MSVYFALSPDNLVKIGFSEKPLERINSLRCGSGKPLRLMAVIDGDMAEERRCHMRFGQYYSHGEWFFHRGKLRAFLKVQPLPQQPDYRPIGNKNQMHEADIQLLTERLQTIYGCEREIARAHVLKMGPLQHHRSRTALIDEFEADLHVKGEWFKYTGALKAFVEALPETDLK